MRKVILLSGLSIITAALLTGCGGGNSNTLPANNDDTNSGISKGQFIDSAVANIEYKSESGLEGKTDANGTFEYIDGDKVQFHIGKLILGEAKPKKDEPITPKDLAEDNKTLTLMLQVLQSLDSDNNTSNGITIPKDVVESLKEKNKEIKLAEINKSEVLTLDDKLKEHIDKNKDGKIDVDEKKAHNHFKSTLDKIKKSKNKDKDKSDNIKDKQHGKNGNNDESNATKGKQHGEGGIKGGNSNSKPGIGNGKGGMSGENNATRGEQHGKGGMNGEKSADKGKQHSDGSIDYGNNNLKAVIDVNSYEKYNLTQELKDAIAYMGNEERLAYDIYKSLYDIHQENGDTIKQLNNIATKSEIRHIQTVRDIVKKYNINASELTKLDKAPVGDINSAIDSIRGQYDIQKIQDLYDALYDKGVTSKRDALEVGCMVEVTDVNDLNEYIKLAKDANVQDVEDAFVALRKGSYNHYWAFDNGLKNIGVENGCCSLGTIDGVDYCHPEYPKNDSSRGEQHGKGGMSGENNTTRGEQHGKGSMNGENNNTKPGMGHGKGGMSGENNATKGEQHGKGGMNGENNATKGEQHGKGGMSGENNATKGEQHGKGGMSGENNATKGEQHGKGGMNGENNATKGEQHGKDDMSGNNNAQTDKEQNSFNEKKSEKERKNSK